MMLQWTYLYKQFCGPKGAFFLSTNLGMKCVEYIVYIETYAYITLIHANNLYTHTHIYTHTDIYTHSVLLETAMLFSKYQIFRQQYF